MQRAYSAMVTLAAEFAQRKPIRALSALEGATHIGHRQFAAALGPVDDAMGDAAVRLRRAIDDTRSATDAAIAALTARAEAAERDAARYRWLIERGQQFSFSYSPGDGWRVTRSAYGRELSAAIDAAMGGASQEKPASEGSQG